MNSEPLIQKNGTPASPATARASSVLPVPGGPISSTPLGTWPPRRWNFSGLLRNSTIFLQLVLGALHVGHVVEGDRLFAFLVPLGRAFGETRQESAAQDLVTGTAEHHPHAREQQHRHHDVHCQHITRIVPRLGGTVILAQLFQQRLFQLGTVDRLGGNHGDELLRIMGEFALPFRFPSGLTGGTLNSP